MVVLFKCSFLAFRFSNKLQEVHLNLVDDSLVVLTKEKFMSAISLKMMPSTKFYSPNTTNVFIALYQMGYQAKLKGVGELKKNKLPAV